MAPRSRRARRAARRRREPLATLVSLLTFVLFATGCTSSTTDQAEPSPSSPVPPTRARVDLSGLPVPRTDVCGMLDENGVTEALDGPVTGTDHYGNGDEVEVRPGYKDVSHEYGCVFEGGDGTAARTWVFARPVARSEARTLVRRARRGRDCAFPDAVGFGSPGLTSVCEIASGATGSTQRTTTVRARLEGLFTDTWMGCEVSEKLG